jgi:4-hydroxy-3-methylbut-2-en-1-yl diphosphate reductase
LILAPLRLEARALRAGHPGLELAVCGVGFRRARRAVAHAVERGADVIVMTGFCGALDPELAPGDLVVASEVRAGGRSFASPLSGELLAALPSARRGVIASAPHPTLSGRARRRLWATGAMAVDMESGALAAAAGEVPWAVLRAVLDAPGREPWRPLATLSGFRRASAALRASAPVLAGFPSAAETGMMHG